MAETHPNFRAGWELEAARNYGIEYGKGAPAPALLPEEPGFSLDLATLWRDLMQLKWFAPSGFCSSTHCFLVLSRDEARGELRPAVARALSTLEKVLAGESPKVLAYDGSVSTSTVAARCAIGMQSIGGETKVSAAPLLFLLAAHAARGTDLGSALVRPITSSESQRWLVRYERPDLEFGASLTDAEREVVRLLLEGRNHAQMSQIRQRSERTIANQLGSAFRKLGATGRTGLVAKLLRERERERDSKPDANPKQRLH